MIDSPIAWNPAYVAARAADRHTTEAMGDLSTLERLLPERRADIVKIYNQLSTVRGQLEHLTQDIPYAHADDRKQTQSR